MIFRFASSFEVGAAPEVVVSVLRDVENWPGWWPQVRHVQEYADGWGLIVIRSVLPLTLRVEARREVDTDDTLRAALAGDLRGWVQFALRPTPTGTLVEFTQESDVGKRGLSAVSRLGAPVLRANHAAMMRSGVAGLRRRCATYPG